MNDFLKIVGKNIKSYRKKKKLTQVELALNTKLTPNYIGLIEQGKRNPTVATLYKISKSMKVNICELFKKHR